MTLIASKRDEAGGVLKELIWSGLTY